MKILALGMASIGSMAGADPALSGLGSLTEIAQSIQQLEGWYAPGQNPNYPNGTLSWRNNNPGNIIYTNYYAQNFNATRGEGGFSKFPNYQTGFAALEHQIQLYALRGETLSSMMAKYAPASDNNDPAAYAYNLASLLGASPSTSVQTLISGSPSAPGAVPGYSGYSEPVLVSTISPGKLYGQESAISVLPIVLGLGILALVATR